MRNTFYGKTTFPQFRLGLRTRVGIATIHDIDFLFCCKIFMLETKDETEIVKPNEECKTKATAHQAVCILTEISHFLDTNRRSTFAACYIIPALGTCKIQKQKSAKYNTNQNLRQSF